MKIHSDILSRGDLWAALPDGCDLEAIRRGSRSRAHAYDVWMAAERGTDAHGIKRCYARNSGIYGAERGFDRAATWVEWGDWIGRLFLIDPNARIGPYEGAAGFIQETTHAAAYRPARENAPTHAARWARALEGWHHA